MFNQKRKTNLVPHCRPQSAQDIEVFEVLEGAEQQKPKFPWFIFAAALFTFALEFIAVSASNANFRAAASAAAGPPAITNHYGFEKDVAPLRLLSTPGYAEGRSAIFWMNGQVNEDYPFSCHCDPGQKAEYDSGALGPVSNTTGDWWNPVDTSTSDLASGVVCSGYYSTGVVFESGTPFCDAKNAAGGVFDCAGWLTLFIVCLCLMCLT